MITVGLLVFTSSFVWVFFLVVPALRNALLSALVTVRTIVVLKSTFPRCTFCTLFLRVCSVPGMFSLLGTFATAHYSLLAIVVDLAVDSWLRFVLAVAVLVPFTFTVYLVLFATLYRVPIINIFFIRLVLFGLVVFVVTLFIPYDPIVHLFGVSFLLLLVELPLLLRFFWFSYSGRVA
jgi:hypothetical protein